MLRAVANRFVPVALVFLLACVSVLFFAAASTFEPCAGQQHPESRAQILFTLLR
jgi:hypothetical protein